jgi:hypothetical protein
MYSKLFCKELAPIGNEGEFIDSIAKNKMWWTAKNNDDGSLTFVADKPNAGFYMARLKKFPNIVNAVLEAYPDAIIDNSYVTKCLPGYHMVPHVDANRTTAIIIPLGDNKGKISYYFKNYKIFTHTYRGPTLTRVNMLHSAENDSEKNRYSITIEVPGSYRSNFFKYQ